MSMKKLLVFLLCLLALFQSTPDFAQVIYALAPIQPGFPNYACGAGPTLSPGTGSYTSAQTVTISCSTAGASIFFTTNGTAPTTGSTPYTAPITVSASEQVQAIATASGYLQSHIGAATYTINAGGAISYPRIGIQAISGNQYFPTANLQRMAQYAYIEMGGNFAGWPGINASNGGYGTRDQVVVALKSYTSAGGKNVVLPQVWQYENPTEINPSAPWFIDWANAVNCNNWWVYNSFASGTKTQSAYNASYTLANPAHLVGTDGSGCDNTGYTPWQLLTWLAYKRFNLGTGDGGSPMASTHLDGYFFDNQEPRNLAGSAADFLRNGTNPSQTDPTATTATTTGKADYCSELATLNSSIACGANTEFAYDLSPTGNGGLGMTSAGNTGIYKLGMNQFLFGETSNAVLAWGGFSVFMAWYNVLESNLAAGGTPVLTGQINTTDYVTLRYSLTAVLMRNGIFVSGLNNGGGEESVDPGNTATYPVFDEFWGGTKNLGGYMGTTTTGARGAEQTGSWSNGVWERTYSACIALVNPAGNGTQTVNVTGLGFTNLYYLHGTQDATHNPGGSTPVTTVSINAGDGYILCNTPSAANLPAANDDYFHQRLSGEFKEAA